MHSDGCSVTVRNGCNYFYFTILSLQLLLLLALMSILSEAPFGFQIGLVVACPPPLRQCRGAVFTNLPDALPGARVGNRVDFPPFLLQLCLSPCLTPFGGNPSFTPPKNIFSRRRSQHQEPSLRPKWLRGKIFCESLEGAGRGRKGRRRKWSPKHLLPSRRRLGSPRGPRGRVSPHSSCFPAHPGCWPLCASLLFPEGVPLLLSQVQPQPCRRAETWAALSLPCLIKMQKAPLSKKMRLGSNHSQPSGLSGRPRLLAASIQHWKDKSGMRELRPERITSQASDSWYSAQAGQWGGAQASVSSSAPWG